MLVILYNRYVSQESGWLTGWNGWDIVKWKGRVIAVPFVTKQFNEKCWFFPIVSELEEDVWGSQIKGQYVR